MELGEWVVQVTEGVLYVHPTPSQVFGPAAFTTVNVQEQRPKTVTEKVVVILGCKKRRFVKEFEIREA
jgi:hypothetical protein